MIKAIVVARDYSQFATYIRNRGFKRDEYGYFQWDSLHKIRGLDKKKVKVLWLEGWSDGTPNYKYDDDVRESIQFLKLFTNHSEVGEGWIYGQDSFI